MSYVATLKIASADLLVVYDKFNMNSAFFNSDNV